MKAGNRTAYDLGRLQRYHMIRYLCAMQGRRVKDLHAEFSAQATARAEPGCNKVTFYRICAGARRSERIERWIARALRTPYRALWGSKPNRRNSPCSPKSL